MKNWKIGTRFAAGFGVVLFLMIAVTTLNEPNLRKTDQERG
jgi:hypothetical protein